MTLAKQSKRKGQPQRHDSDQSRNRNCYIEKSQNSEMTRRPCDEWGDNAYDKNDNASVGTALEESQPFQPLSFYGGQSELSQLRFKHS
jgi:hypothetical protein